MSYGTNYYDWGDINRHLKSYNESSLFETTRRSFPDLIAGEIKGLPNLSPDFEVEMRVDLGRLFALNLATSSPLHQRKENSITCLEHGLVGQRETYAYLKPQVKVAMPLRLGVSYVLPFGPSLNIFFSSGLGYYSARISEYRYERQRTSYADASESVNWEIRYWETAPRGAVGLWSGIGIEFWPHKSLALVLEVRGTYLKIGDLRGTRRLENAGGSSSTRGTLYSYEYGTWSIYFSGRSYDDLTIWQEPESGWDEVRKAVLDLSGYSLRAGIRIRPF